MAGQSLQKASVVVRLPKSLSLAFAGGKTAFPAQDANGAEEGLVVHSIVLCCTTTLNVSLHTTFLSPRSFVVLRLIRDYRCSFFYHLFPSNMNKFARGASGIVL